MNKLNKVLIMVGSPKGENSVSNNIATYIQDKFEQNNVKTSKKFIIKHRSKESLEKLIYEIDCCDPLILTSPLYVDSLPSIVINLMEEINVAKTLHGPEQKFMAIINSGFPEPHQNDLAIDMCKNFAHQSNMKWLGGVTVGMGPALDGRPLDRTGGLSKNLRSGLDTAIKALSEGRAVPPEALATASKPLMPLFLSKSMLNWFGNRMWTSQVKDEDVKKKMYLRPHESAR